ncbi:MAG TPA: hypothetical protein VFM55_00625 [Micromonosporaceae bacterium]|nr:hypothetical protein [Micromonosporaceae bacterium]
MRAVELIERKRDGGRLEAPEIDALVRGYVGGEIPDYQMSAFLMAVVLRGMDDRETAALTASMVASGERLELSRFGRVVDKHSTGGGNWAPRSSSTRSTRAAARMPAGSTNVTRQPATSNVSAPGRGSNSCSGMKPHVSRTVVPLRV